MATVPPRPTSRLPTKAELKRNLKELQARLGERPMDLDARMRVARTYRLLEKRDDAVAHYAAVARYLSLAGHPLQAIAVLKELLQVDPRHEETLLFLAKLYARTRAADASNRGRVAVPILEPGESPRTLVDGIPLTTTGIWRAIAPAQPEDLAVVHDADELGARVDRSADNSSENSSEDVAEDDILDAADDDAGGVLAPDADLGDDYVILGQMTTGDVLLPRVPLFSSLSPEAFVHLSHAMVFQKVPAGTRIFTEGQSGDSCIVVSRGRARVSRADRLTHEDVELLQLGEGDIAGVFALMAGQVRLASLTAVSDVEYFEIDRGAVDDLVQKFPAMREVLHAFFRDRLILNVLASLPFFSTLSAEDRRNIALRFQDRALEVGDELFSEGTDNDGLWIVLSGEVRVGKEVGDAVDARVVLGAGDFVGSTAHLDDAETDLAAVAAVATHCAVLTHKSLAELMERHSDVQDARARVAKAGLLVGEHVYAGNGTLAGALVQAKPAGA